MNVTSPAPCNQKLACELGVPVDQGLGGRFSQTNILEENSTERNLLAEPQV